MKIKIGASILSSDFSSLGLEIKRLENAGVDFLSFDIMDGHFVDNISFGPGLVKALRDKTKLPFEAHLMVEAPGKFARRFIDAGCEMLTVHYESCQPEVMEEIRKEVKLGLAIRPETPVSKISGILDKIDMLLIMTVNPGFGGQEFIDQSRKIMEARKIVEKDNLDIDIGVDGGINGTTAKTAVGAGANVLISGSFISGHSDYREAVKKLRGL